MDPLPDVCHRHILAQLPSSCLPSLLCLNRSWFLLIAPILYRNPFQTLKDLSDRLTLDTMEIQAKGFKLVLLLLRCCKKQQLLANEYTGITDMDDPPFFDYLSLYQDQTSRYMYLVDGNNYFEIRSALLSYIPQRISRLRVSIWYMTNLTQLANQLSSLQRLELVCDDPENLNWGLLNVFAEKHQQVHRNTLQELVLIMPRDWVFQEVDPLLLDNWTRLQKLDLTLWRGILDWKRVPKQNLTDLRLDLGCVSKSFDPGSFFGPCTNLRTLHVLGLRKSTFDWITNETLHPVLPQLTTLELCGNRDALTPCLDILAAVSETLTSLTLTLQEPVSGCFVKSNLKWSTLLPRLSSLSIQDKAIFEFDPAVMKNCPSLRMLVLDIDAEHSGPSCTELGNPRSVKWVTLHSTLEKIGMHGAQLQELRLQGFWICGEAAFLSPLQSMKQLRRLYLDWRMLRLTLNGLCKIVESLERLESLEAPKHVLRPRSNGDIPACLERSGLEVRLTEYSYYSDLEQREDSLVIFQE
ncbi:hypothetical protein B0O80DRAFT_426442 [Mortierella sp. GBAus27b]|nr:hypothetical protein BGX31_006984 [Mortierella sp. GBA43]KAI8354416.1 hypothetical protein B0O80DRAFT_426442 [Mortierella sp. GBAus27b]